MGIDGEDEEEGEQGRKVRMRERENIGKMVRMKNREDEVVKGQHNLLRL